MTLFGCDISNNNDGGTNTIDLTEIINEGFSWIEAKVSEGNHYRDPDWPRIRDFCKVSDIPYIGYHYVTTDPPAQQAATWVANGGGPNAMLDFELNSGDISNFWAVLNAFRNVGVTVRLSYIPHWYWQQIGAPDITNAPGLVASNYVVGTGYAAQLYPGDSSARWFPYGGAAPQILQFSAQAIVANLQVCDVNAFRGTTSQLRQLLGLPPASIKGVFMALSDVEQSELLTKVREVWDQLRGPGGHGWPQLGQNAAGQNLSLVDAVANVENVVETVEAAVKPVKTRAPRAKKVEDTEE